jgi:hypothetical protein
MRVMQSHPDPTPHAAAAMQAMPDRSALGRCARLCVPADLVQVQTGVIYRRDSPGTVALGHSLVCAAP